MRESQTETSEEESEDDKATSKTEENNKAVSNPPPSLFSLSCVEITYSCLVWLFFYLNFVQV